MMKKTFSKNQLQKKAQDAFEQYPLAKQVFATVDGMVFLNKNRAELHSKDTIYTFDRTAAAVESNSDDTGASDTKIDYREAVKTIKEAETLADIEPFAADDRKSVKSAYDKRKAELEASKLEFLIGSSKQPIEFELKDGSKIPLGDVVAEAHKNSGLTVSEWNKLSEDKPEQTEKLIQDVVETLDLKESEDELVIQLQDDLKIIETAEALADIETFEADERDEVKEAYEAKKAELIKDLNVNE